MEHNNVEKSLLDNFNQEGGDMNLEDIVKEHELDVKLVGFDVNDWGSCQYSGALDFFNVMNGMEEKYGREIALTKMGIELTAVPVSDGVKEFVETHLEIYQDDIKRAEDELKKVETLGKPTRDYFDDAEQQIGQIKDNIDWFQDHINELEEVEFDSSLDCLFELTKSWAWDLWSAAPEIVSYGFEKLDINGIRSAPGVGPVLNMMAQSENYEVGFYCWLARSFGLVKSQESFANYDT